MSAQHAKWLREAAEQIAKAGHNGWGNTCLDAAASIEALVADLAAERARADRAEAANVDTVWLVKDHERLEAALRELGKHPEECDDESGACVSHLAYEDVKADRDRLRAALDFYACVDHYHGDKYAAPNVVQCDKGERARAALAQEGEG